jgi:UDP-2,3-diacylglucosamine pyrophosphatase LpxH
VGATERRLIVLSDLHLGAPGGRDGGAACAAFLASMVWPDAHNIRLLFLGDMFELRDHHAASDASATDEVRAIQTLDALASQHPSFFAALAVCLRSGCELDIVPGNHDMPLARPNVHGYLASLLDAADRITVHPWLFTIPGLLLAEHGHQQHDLNRFPTLLSPGRWSDPGTDFVPPLAAWHRRRIGPLVRAVADLRRHERAAASVRYRSLLHDHADQASLPREVVVRLHEQARFRLVRTGIRLLRRALSRRHRRTSDAYLVAAARRTQNLLTASGISLPLYICGHSHRARAVQLAPDRWYLNSGTWADEVRGTGPDSRDEACFPYLEISPRGGSSDSLRYWRWSKEATAGPIDAVKET